MKKLITMAVLAGVVFSAAAQTKTRSLTLPDFTGVDVSSYFQIEISKGDKIDVEITYSAELEPYIVSKVNSSGVLRLGIDTKDMPRDMKRENNRGKYILSAKIIVPDLVSLNASGATKVDFQGRFTPRSFKGDFSGASSVKGLDINTQSLSIDCSGASKLQISGNISGKASYDFSGASNADIRQDIGKLDIEVSGASNINLKGSFTDMSVDLSGASSMDAAGKGDKLNVEVSGASHFNGKDLSVNSASVDASGASRAFVNVSKVLNVDITGSSSLRYSDSRSVQINVKNVSKGASLIKQ